MTELKRLEKLLNNEAQNNEFVIDGKRYKRGDKFETKQINCWRIVDNELIKLGSSDVGTFFDDDSYIVSWTYASNNTDHTIYFNWKGVSAAKGYSPLPNFDDENAPPVNRIVQWAEPPIFLQIFQGRMIVRSRKPNNHLFIVRGDTKEEQHLIEVACERSSLRSLTSFVLINFEMKTAFIWHGIKTKIDGIAAVHDYKTFEMKEGFENDAFQEAVSGDKNDYFSGVVDADCRLFYFNRITGELLATEVQYFYRNLPFLQSHLYTAYQPALFILLTSEIIWIWQGWDRKNNEDFDSELNMVKQAAVDFGKIKLNRDFSPIKMVFAGLEPLQFTNLFPFWEKRTDITALQIQDGLADNSIVNIEIK